MEMIIYAKGHSFPRFTQEFVQNLERIVSLILVNTQFSSYKDLEQKIICGKAK